MRSRLNESEPVLWREAKREVKAHPRLVAVPFDGQYPDFSVAYTRDGFQNDSDQQLDQETLVDCFKAMWLVIRVAEWRENR